MNEERLNELLKAISNNPKYNNRVFYGSGIYFIICDAEITEISDDAGCSPRGGWFPDIISGPTEDENKCLESMMEKFGFDEEFFRDITYFYGEFDEDYVEEYFEEQEDERSLEIYRKIKKKIESGKTPFDSVNSFANALGRFGLDSDVLYYEWEGEHIDLYDNIAETGEYRGYYDNMSDEEWITLLEHIDEHILTV